MKAEHANHEYVGPEEVRKEMRRAARAASTPPRVRAMCGRLLREIAAFEAWVEPLFDKDNARAVTVAERAGELEEYAAFTLRIMRRAGLGEPYDAVDEQGYIAPTDEEIVQEVVDALAACVRYFWVARNGVAWPP